MVLVCRARLRENPMISILPGDLFYSTSTIITE
jgi:hypothetical protein